jgi:basic membrane protein A
MTKTDIIGYVAAFPIPEVIRGINALTTGVRKVNPRAKVKVLWTNTWNDPPTERVVTDVLLKDKADVIAQHQNTFAPQQAAQERGVYSIGFHQDMSRYAPKAHLTACVWNWGPYYMKTVEQVKAGTWKSEQYWGGIKDGIVDIAPFGPMVPDEVKKMVMAEREKIIQGSFTVFEGPIRDSSGNMRVPKGKKMSDEELMKLDWFVEGVEGKSDAQSAVPLAPQGRLASQLQ